MPFHPDTRARAAATCRSLVFTALGACLLAPCNSLMAQRPARDAGAPFVVSTAWLAAHQRDRDLVLVQVLRDTSSTAELIPGSRRLTYRDIVTTRDSNSNELPTVDALKATIEKLGISNRSRVVVYAPDAPLATRVLFTLDYLGHDRIAFLDGGLRQWKREQRQVTTVVTTPAPATFTPHPRPERLVSAEWLAERLDKPGLTMIDTRTLSDYVGTAAGGGASAGHITGAQSLPWEELFGDADLSLLKPREALRQMYEERVRPGDEVVTYCIVGYRGSATWFIARYLGYDAVKLYDGSYQDWSRRKLPLRAGAAP